MRHTTIYDKKTGRTMCTACGQEALRGYTSILENADDCPGSIPNSSFSFAPEPMFKSTDDRRVENNLSEAAPPNIPGDPMRLNYRVLMDHEKANMADVKVSCARLWEKIDTLGSSREISIAKTKLEEACMWAVKHITGPKT